MHYTVIGNWKMHGTAQEAAALASAVSDYASASVEQARVVLCPPALHVPIAVEHTAGSAVLIGGQNCHAQEKGAHTGEISAAMLKDSGAEYVILGHSERRSEFGESNAAVASKAVAAVAAGLIPVICVGETLEQRESGQYKEVLRQQVSESVPAAFAVHDYVLAYEPVWAIGTGKVADTHTIQQTHQLIAEVLPAGASILYGGSVKPQNAEEILAVPHVDGVLVGGASLQAESFNAIIAAAEAAAVKV